MSKKEDRYLELERAYAEQLKRKDAEIEELKRKNEILMKTAIRQNEKVMQLQELVKKIEKTNKK